MTNSKMLLIASYVLILGALALAAGLGHELSKVTPDQTRATATLNTNTINDGYTNFAKATLEDGSVMVIQVDRPTFAGEEAPYWILDETGEPLTGRIIYQLEDTNASKTVETIALIIGVVGVIAFISGCILYFLESRKERRERNAQRAQLHVAPN